MKTGHSCFARNRTFLPCNNNPSKKSCKKDKSEYNNQLILDRKSYDNSYTFDNIKYIHDNSLVRPS